jgi:hypothetical protein
MTEYVKSTNFASKDTLPAGNALKIVKGTELNTEFDNISTAVATKADLNSPTFLGTVAIPTLTLSTTPLAVSYGGTGVTTAQAEMNRVAAAVTSGSYLRGNGTNVVMSAIQAADVPTLNQNTTGSAATCTGNAATATALSTASGSAPSYGIRAWANYNGVSGTINASGNIASISHDTTGQYTVTFTTAMPDANYAINIGVGAGGSNIASVYLNQTAGGSDAPPTASAFTFTTNQPGSGLRDQKYLNITVTR